MSLDVLGVSLTVAATAISVYNTILFVRQGRLVEKQALLQRSQVYPFLRILKSEISENTLRLTLQNLAEAPAFQLGLLVHFMPCSGWDQHWQFVDEVPSYEDQKMKKNYPTQVVIPLKNKYALSRIYGNETDIYEAEPLFIFKDTRKDPWQASGKADTFDELEKRLLGQKIRFVAVMISVVYKDVAETINEFGHLADFVVDFEKHESFKQAYEEGIPFHDKTIGYEQMPFLDYCFYQHLKDYRGRLES